MNLYRIKNWEDHYENNRSRTVKDLAWVPIPNRHDGESYARIMAHKDAAEIFTVWILLLQVASRCHPRGTLLRNDGKPHDPESLSIKTRARQEWFEKSLPVLKEMSWLEHLTEESQETDTLLSAHCQSGDEEGRKEQNGKNGRGSMIGFPAFWELYPKSKDRDGCEKAWGRLKLTPEKEQEILGILRHRIKSKDWMDQGGKFIPNPLNWIEKKGWEDKVKTNGHATTLRKLPEGEGIKNVN